MIDIVQYKDSSKCKQYIIRGEPRIPARFNYGRRLMTAQLQEHLHSSIQLTNQHEGPPLSGPLYIKVVFYIPLPISLLKLKNKDHLLDKPCTARPKISDLLAFIDDIANGVIFKDYEVAQLETEKIYSSEPRTEITVIKL